MLAGVFKSRRPLPVAKAFPKSGLMQGIVIADPHIGKLAWGRETRAGDYDLNIADEVLRAGIAHLRDMGNVAVRHFWLLGDVFHYDTPNGTTTKGTPLDRDGRVQKMIEVGASVLCDALEASAKEVPTVVTLVPGNHDTILTYALQRILQSHFRHTKQIQIDGGYETRKYLQWGQCLIGLTHGDKAVKTLPSLMAREAAVEWGQTTHRVIHKGHLHYRRSVESLEGVTLYQHPALCPPDGWHASEGYVAERGMESHVYHSGGATTQMRFYAPDLGRPVSKGTR
jgi:predicted phosphodiesterase